MTTALYVDLDGTLLRYTEPFPTLFARAAPTAPPEAFESYRTALFAAFDDLDPDPFGTAFARVVDAYDLSVDPRTLRDAYLEVELDATTVSDPARDVLARAAERGSVGILTNGGPEMQKRKVDRHGLAEYADAVVVSNDPAVAARKPDRSIFEYAGGALPADEHVYVGDSYEEDILGARAAGWRAVHVRGDGSLEAVETGERVTVERLLDG
ncbi:HAD family hydrolase [Haloferacaceae archaeon DSL9]